MATLRATTIGGKIIPKAVWTVKTFGALSEGEVIRVNIAFKDEKLTRYLTKSAAQECTLEREEDGSSVTLGLIVERFSHLLDDSKKEPDVESMAWIKPMNRAVEAVLSYLLDRENCDTKFLAALGAKRKEGESEPGV